MPWRILFCRDREIPTAAVGALDHSECYTFPAGVHLAKGGIYSASDSYSTAMRRNDYGKNQ